MNNNNVNLVVISTERYEQLLDTETRVNVLVDRLRNETAISTKDVFLTLGYVSDYERIDKEDEEAIKKFFEEKEKTETDESNIS